MASSSGDTEFEFVGSWSGPEETVDSSQDAVRAEASPSIDGEIPEASVRAMDQPTDERAAEAGSVEFRRSQFPLAGPILESAEHELKGRCSGCDSRLRIRVESKGPVKIRCPICGRTKRITV